jgi:hypothetical protein
MEVVSRDGMPKDVGISSLKVAQGVHQALELQGAGPSLSLQFVSARFQLDIATRRIHISNKEIDDLHGFVTFS